VPSQPAQPSPENRLRFFREQAGLSQERLARRADLSLWTVSRVENGRDPSLTTARKLAAALDRAVADIWPELAA